VIQALLWDMDGVLVDTTDIHFWSWSIALQEHGWNLSHQDFLKTFGMNNRATLHQLFGPLSDKLIETIIDRKEILFRQNLNGQVKIYPGVIDWLEFARKNGVFCAIASSAPPENITAILEHFKLAPYFSVLVSASALPSKPDPVVFLKAAKRLKMAPQSCLVVEDAPSGALAANRAGMHCLVVLTTRTKPEFPPVDLIMDRLSDRNPAEVLNKIDQVV